MIEEYWGTLSIYDHRDEIFAKSLILFDRIVIPIPQKAIHDLTNQELDKLNADAEFLKENDAAIIYDWKQAEFDAWRDYNLREALTAKLSDAEYDSRLMLTEESVILKPNGVFDVTAVPVYSAREKFLNSYTQFSSPAESLIVGLSQAINLPDGDTPLQDIVELRNRESFQSAKRALHEWQLKIMPGLIKEDSKKNLALAMEDFNRMLERYNEEIKKSSFKTGKTIISSLLVLSSLFEAYVGHKDTALALLAGATPNIYSLIEAGSPAWKKVRDKPFEAAGVIYEANKALA